MIRYGVLILAAMLTFGAQAEGRSVSGAPAIVAAPAGKVEGASAGGVDAFLGIPYARPPVGELRWRPPQPVPSWRPVRPARAFGFDCPQETVPGDPYPSNQPQSEDCLYLNVWRPTGARALPVMVWIHGGGWVSGTSAWVPTEGAGLARRGVIIVSFNYRLGRFGFFAHPALTAEAKGRPPVNYAFLDMIAALKWVKANIAAFGGDPRQVTIFGESAGGAAVNFLMASPEARGLFDKAIVESGANRDVFARLKEDRPFKIAAEKAGVAFAKSAGLLADATPAQLRALPADVVAGKLSMWDMQADRFAGPAIDGSIVVADPIDRFADGSVPVVPYLIGSNGHELSEESFARIILDALVKYTPSNALAELKRAYGDPLDPAVIDDFLFGEAARGYARIMAKRGSPTWLYRFDYVAEENRATRNAANHASEIAFVFGNLPESATAHDRAIAKAMGDYWVNFAKSGNPNGKDLVKWPAQGAGDPMLVIANAGPHEARDDNSRLDAVERAQALRPR